MAVGELFDDGERGGACGRISPKRPAETAGSRGVHDLGAAGDGGERESSAEGLGGEDEVGLDGELLGGEEGSGAAEAGLDFVRYENDAVLLAGRVEDLEEACGRDDESAFAKHRLDDDCGDLFGGDDSGEDVFEHSLVIRSI